ncbi:unnamed protein product [Lactuca virosa]|uniref:Uncharacterized protein n=1 Tax=Lactuca virosa TaxID=75947 RepID=A0AAU9LV46_9ASTR|nr:unnamed protein product [Lactuca virosa]
MDSFHLKILLTNKSPTIERIQESQNGKLWTKEGTNEEERDTERMDKRDRKMTDISLPRSMRFLLLLSLIFEQIFTGWSTITWSCYKISQSV